MIASLFAKTLSQVMNWESLNRDRHAEIY